MCNVTYTILIKCDNLSNIPILSLKFDNGICCMVTCFWGTDTEKLLKCPMKENHLSLTSRRQRNTELPLQPAFPHGRNMIPGDLTVRSSCFSRADQTHTKTKNTKQKPCFALFYFFWKKSRHKRFDGNSHFGFIQLFSTLFSVFLGPPLPCWESRIVRHRASSS